MINILVVDDIEENLEVMELLIDEYMSKKNIIDYGLILNNDATKTLNLLKENNIHILFLDIMMPLIDGLELLNKIRAENTINQPIIVMATALSDKETRIQEQKLGANAFMLKPISYKVINIMLDKYLEVLNKNEFDIDDSFDFDFDDLDFDEEINNNEFETLIKNQDNYAKIDAVEFVSQYSWNIDTINNKLEDLNYLIFKLFDSLVYENITEVNLNLYEDYSHIKEILEEYDAFITMFSELSDLNKIIKQIIFIFEFNDIKILNYSELAYLTNLIKAIMNDLISYTEKVFIDKTATNIYYLNASIATSCLELENIFKVK